MGKEGTHSGHRQRVRMEFFENGFSSNTPTHKIVALRRAEKGYQRYRARAC